MAAVLEYISYDTQINDAVHSDIDIGDAHPDRQVVIAVAGRGTVTSVDIGGVSAKSCGPAYIQTLESSIWIADVPFGRTADITIGGAEKWSAIRVYRGVNVEHYDVHGEGGASINNVTASVDADDTDTTTIAVGSWGSNGNSATWTTLTERVDEAIDVGDTADRVTFADDIGDQQTGALTITLTSSGSEGAIVVTAASFRSANVAREIVVESTESGTSFACPQGTNLLVVVTADGAAQTGITYDGVSLTNVSAAVSGTASYAEVWVLKRPPVNSTLTLAGMTGEYYSVCLSGVDLKSAIEVAENSSTSTALTSFETVLGSLSDEVFLLDAFRLDSQVTPSVGSGQTSIETGSTADPEGWGFSYKTVDSDAFDSMSWTFASADEPAHAVAILQPQRLKSPAYQHEEVEGTLTRVDFNYGANDQGPYRARFTTESSPTFASGVCTFDGTDDRMTASFDQCGDGIFTISFWMKENDWSGDDRPIQIASGSNAITIQHHSNGVRFVFDVGGTSNNIYGTINVDDSQWHHIVAIGDGTTFELFIDGVSDGTVTKTAGNFTPTTLSIGAPVTGTTNFYDGDLADVRIIGRAATNAEVADLYARGINNLPVRRKWDSDPDLVLDIDPRKGMVDRSGAGLIELELQNNAFFDTDGALTTDGTGDGLNGPTTAVFTGETEMSVALWVKFDSIIGNIMLFHNAHSGVNAEGFLLLKLSSGNLLRFQVGDGTTWSLIPSTTAVAVDTWYHVVGTFADGGNAKIYVNGEEENSVSFTGPVQWSASPLFQFAVDDRSPSTVGDVNGKMLGMRIWKRELTSGEVREQYNLTRPELNLNVDPPQRRQLHGCVGHWTAATEGRDLSGNGHHLTYEGTATVNGGVFDTPGTSSNYLDTNTTDLVHGADGVTYACWVYSRSHVTSHGIMYAGGSDYGGLSYTPTNQIRFYLRRSTGVTSITSSGGEYTTGGWHHVVGTWQSGETQKLYIDGVLAAEGSTLTGTMDQTSSIRLGSDEDIATRVLDGLMDDCQIYNRGLTNGEVKALYQAGVPYYERPERRKLTGEAFHISASEGAVQLSDGAGVTYNGDVSIVDNEYEFDGTGDFITTDYQFKPPFTILTWLDTDQTSSIAVAIGTEENSRSRIGTTTSNRWMFEWSSASAMLINGATTGLHLLALTVDSSGNAEAFADGVSIGTSTGASTSTATLKIGRTFTTTTQDWDGSIADVKVYERVLNPEEIAIEYNNGTSGYEPSVNHLEAPYQCVDRWCPTISDSSNSLTDSAAAGTYNGDATTISDLDDHGEKAYDFDGTGDYVDIPDMFPQAGYTFTAHAKFDDTTGSLEMAYAQRDVPRMYLGANAGNSYIRAGDDSGSLGASLSSGEFHSLICVTAASGYEGFVNGASIGSRSGISWGGSNAGCAIGAYNSESPDTQSNFMAGQVDDVMRFKRDLGQAEINWISSERGIRRPLDPYNPVAWWCPSLDFPNAGTLNLMDLARDQHGTLTNMVAADDWVISTERGGTRALDFDGTDDYVDVGSGLFNGWTQFTVATWVYVDAITIRGSVLAQVGDGTNYNFEFGPGYATAGSRNKFVCSFWSEGVDAWKTWVDTDCPTGEWVHYAAVWDGVGVKMFVNGVEDTVANTVGTANSPIQTVTNLNANIGKYERSPGYYFDGKVDDLRVYDKALPLEAIKNLASKRGWTPEETTTITTASDAAAATIFPFWAIIDDNNSFG